MSHRDADFVELIAESAEQLAELVAFLESAGLELVAVAVIAKWPQGRANLSAA